jgi:oligopeptide transport system substrate-binding protein
MEERMKKLLFVVLAALLSGPLLFARGGQQPSSGRAQVGNELIMAFGIRPNLDPHWNAGTTGNILLRLMYEGLYRYTESGFDFAGATGVTQSPDGLTWTFKLRQDAKWSDGKPVTAKDYVYSIKRLVDPAVGTTYMRDYGQFLKNGLAVAEGKLPVDQVGARAVDDYTLEIKLENVCSFFDALLCYSTFYPLRSDVITEDGTGYWAWDASKSITNGPMKLVFCDEEQEIVLEKNTAYWNAASVKLDRLVVKLLDDANTQLALFNTNQVDLLIAFPSEEVRTLNSRGFYHPVPRLGSGFLLVNTQKSPLSDPQVRRALSLAFDRKYLAETLLNNTRIAGTTFIGRGFPGSAPGKDFLSESPVLVDYNVTEAKNLLARAGYPNGQGFPVLEIPYPTNPDNTTVLEYLQSIWKENLGINVTLTPLEAATMTPLRDEGKFDLTTQNWGADYFDVSNMLSIFAPGNLINAGRYENPAFTEAYNKSLHTVDNAERIRLLHEAERILIQQDAGIIPLFYLVQPFVFRDETVTNVKYDANGWIMFTDVIVKK